MELAVENRFSTASEMSAALGRSEPAPRISAPSSAKPKRQPKKVLPGAQQAVASSRARLSRRQILYGALAAGGLVAGCSAAAAIATLVSQTNDKPPPTPTDKATKVNVVKETEIIIVEPHPTETPVEPVPIRWFIGLVTGSTPEEFDPREVFVDSFSTQHSEIELTVDIVDHEAASDTLKTLIAAGNPPDIVGPVGVRGSNEFVDSFLNLVRYLDSYDMSDFSEGAIVGWTVPGAGLLGLPIGVYPSALYINRDLFDEAGLDVDAAIDTFVAEMQAIFDAAD